MIWLLLVVVVLWAIAFATIIVNLAWNLCEIADIIKQTRPKRIDNDTHC